MEILLTVISGKMCDPVNVSDSVPPPPIFIAILLAVKVRQPFVKRKRSIGKSGNRFTAVL
jgi:hypothetical protein